MQTPESSFLGIGDKLQFVFFAAFDATVSEVHDLSMSA
jgi:hypothetical protein